jgi:hypothetical protein
MKKQVAGVKMELNLPKISSFLCCNNIQQDVLSKNYELRGEFMTFSRIVYDGKTDFQIDISLHNEQGEKISDSLPRKIQFGGELPMHDLITAWRVVIPGPGVYVFKAFCNNLTINEYKIFCR